jgi:hypothetical protein
VRYGVRNLTLGTAVVLTTASVSIARELVDVFSKPLLRNLELAPIGDVLASTVALTYPIPSESSSFVYRYDPERGSFERRDTLPDPVVGERAETLGANRFDVGLSYAYVHLVRLDGRDLDSLENRAVIDGQVVARRFPGGKTLRDGRFTGFLPVDVNVGIDVEAHVLTPSFTYGVTSDLDVNVDVPIVRSSLGVTTRTRTPDPRLPQFALPVGDPDAGAATDSSFDTATGIGDVLVRAKYVVLRDRPVDVALALALSMPTGSKGDLHGSGRVRVAPMLILSRIIADRFEPLLNLGGDVDAGDPDRSILRWAAGVTARIADPVAASLVFLGRHELGAQADRIRVPFFFQIRRSDVIDASVSARVRLGGRGFLGLGVLLPLNDDGLRADAVPVLELQCSF